MEPKAFEKQHGKPKHKKEETFGEGDPFYLVEEEGNAGSYLTGFTTNPKAPVYSTTYDDAEWTYVSSRATHLINTEHLDASVKTFGGGAVAPAHKPPF